MPLASNALTTVAAVCAELSLAVPTSGSTDEADLEARIAAASDAIARFCSRVFGQQDRTERVEGLGGDVLFVRHAPVTAVASIVHNGEEVPLDEVESPPAEGDAESGLVRRLDGCWADTCARRSYVVTYTAGWVLPKDAATSTPRTLPHDVERACILTVVADYLAKGRDPSIVSESALSASVTYAGSQVNSAIGRGAGGIIPDNAAALLSHYRWGT